MMKKFFLLPVCCLTLVALCEMALGQSGAVRKAVYYQGIASNTPQCPAIRYLMRDVSSSQPAGYVWFSDASGMSKATGTMDLNSGQFHLTLTSLDGNGPTGEVTGTKDPNTGVVTAELDGPGCSKLTLGPTNPYVRKADGTD
jgi:hypothetical protein